MDNTKYAIRLAYEIVWNRIGTPNIRVVISLKQNVHSIYKVPSKELFKQMESLSIFNGCGSNTQQMKFHFFAWISQSNKFNSFLREKTATMKTRLLYWCVYIYVYVSRWRGGKMPQAFNNFHKRFIGGKLWWILWNVLTHFNIFQVIYNRTSWYLWK